MASSSSNVVGVHYRVGKKIGEGSFGVIFEGTNLLNNQQVAIKFVRHTLGLVMVGLKTHHLLGTKEKRCTTITR
jgi:serine/threonine protein kinase